MNFENMRAIWTEQGPVHLSVDKSEAARLVRSICVRQQKRDRALYLIALLVGMCSLSVVIFGSALMLLGGASLPWGLGYVLTPPLILTPAYVTTVCLYLIVNYKHQNKMNEAHEKSLRGFAKAALAQTVNRIRLLRLVPLALICLWVAVATGAFAIADIRNAMGEEVSLVVFVTAMDVAIIAAIVWWSRRQIRVKHLPTKTELESIINSF